MDQLAPVRPDRMASRIGWSMPAALEAVWWIATTAPDLAETPSALPPDLQWLPARAPGTALEALHVARAGAPPRLHDLDIWYRAEIVARAEESLRFLGLAGLAEIWIDDALVARSTSMFVACTVAAPPGCATVRIRFASLNRALEAPIARGRWRSRLVTSNALRAQRQTLLGHMPGWCPSFDAVGPYRPIERIAGAGTIASVGLRPSLRGTNGLLAVRITFATVSPAQDRLAVRIERQVRPLRRDRDGALVADLSIPDVRRWWPHTHGNPALYDVFLVDGKTELPIGRTGFREIAVRSGKDGRGFGFEINGVPVFCRGACWSNADLATLACDRDTYLPWLALAAKAGMNMIRVGGTMLYEARAFHELCDELGILVWQDLMFANLDPPTEQPAFRASVLLEVEQLLERLCASPSTAILCGGSEMAQQATLLGLPEERRRIAFLEELLPALVAQAAPGLPYLPHSPWGGKLPITIDHGVSHYYGVGAYRRPLDDARRASVRFASECLAFANPPEAVSPACAAMDRVPRDPGASWTFADTRDHYLRTLTDVDPATLRAEDPDRYLELSRAVTADLMESVFAEWRRPGSPCDGGLVWQLQDVAPGSGWGVIDSEGVPKAAWHGLARVLAPIQILLSDEGLDGLSVHVLNETDRPLDALVSLRCLGRGSVPIVSAEQRMTLAARDGITLSSHSMLDRFFDISRAYRFGPAEHDVTIATLRSSRSGEILSEAFHFPLGRGRPMREPALRASLRRDQDEWWLDIAADSFARAVHVEADHHRAETDWFHLPPERTRSVRLLPLPGVTGVPTGSVRGLDLTRPVVFGSPA